ncbi:acyltransferase [Pseudomonas nitroreducens]|uniref:acyltransferase family protein n=1 Tax=Pseudomonas nitroreducens TaxID=46680 RepID=UPI002448035E|nr:acyltransferase [Pseudomonas nitroreducens]MDG9858229.1 acyltransferase [Pseudomonas nitroreducens]
MRGIMLPPALLVLYSGASGFNQDRLVSSPTHLTYTTDMKTGNIPYLARLDLLRFVAAMAVVIFHFYGMASQEVKSANPYLKVIIEHGHFGVSLFLVMSGYLMCAIYDRNPQIKYSDFIYNRLVRVGPLALVLFLASLFAFWGKVDVTKHVINFITLQFNADTSYQVAPLWTIAVEFQLYLIVGFLYGIIRHKGVIGFVGLLAVLGVGRFMIVTSTHKYGVFSYDSVYYSIFGRIDQFAIGMIAYMLSKNRFGTFRNPAHSLMAILSLLTLFFLSSSIDWNADTLASDLARTYYLTAEALACAYLMISVCNMSMKIPGEKYLAWLGMTSYSIYLWHQLIIETYMHRAGEWVATLSANEFMLQTALIVIPVVIAMSALSYKYIEEPILSLRKSYQKQKQAQPLEKAA